MMTIPSNIIIQINRYINNLKNKLNINKVILLDVSYSLRSFCKKISDNIYKIFIGYDKFLTKYDLENIAKHEVLHIYNNDFEFSKLAYELTKVSHICLNILNDYIINKQIPTMRKTYEKFAQNLSKNKKVVLGNNVVDIVIYSHLTEDEKNNLCKILNIDREDFELTLDYLENNKSRFIEEAKKFLNYSPCDEDFLDEYGETLKWFCQIINKAMNDESVVLINVFGKDYGSSDDEDEYKIERYKDDIETIVEIIKKIIKRLKVDYRTSTIIKTGYYGKRLNRSWIENKPLRGIIKPFKTEEEIKTKKSFEALFIIDGSGSMMDNPLIYACAIAIALREILSDGKIDIVISSSDEFKIIKHEYYLREEIYNTEIGGTEHFDVNFKKTEFKNLLNRHNKVIVFTDGIIAEESLKEIKKIRDNYKKRVIGMYCNDEIDENGINNLKGVCSYVIYDKNIVSLAKKLLNVLHRK